MIPFVTKDRFDILHFSDVGKREMSWTPLCLLADQYQKNNPVKTTRQIAIKYVLFIGAFYLLVNHSVAWRCHYFKCLINSETAIPRGFNIPFLRVPGLMFLWLGMIAVLPLGSCSFIWLPFCPILTKPIFWKARTNSVAVTWGSLGMRNFNRHNELTLVLVVGHVRNDFTIL